MNNKAFELNEKINALEKEIENIPNRIKSAQSAIKDKQASLDSKEYETALINYDIDNRRIRLPIYAAISVILFIVGAITGGLLSLAGVVFLVLAIKNLVQLIKVSNEVKERNDSERNKLATSIKQEQQLVSRLSKELPEKKAELEKLKAQYPEEYNKLEQSATDGDAQACYDLAIIETQRGNAVEGAKWMRFAGERGNVDAQRTLGKIYESRGDYKEAATWYIKAAEQGDGESQYAVYSLSIHEKGISLDGKKDAEYLRKAAENGVVDAQTMLGTTLFFGIGGQQDNKRALYWLEKAAQGHSAPAAYYAGLSYLKGYGTSIDIKKSVDYLKRAADNGIPNAQSLLAPMFLFGQGPIEADKSLAYKYFDAVMSNNRPWLQGATKEDIMPDINFIYGGSLAKDAIERNIASDGSLRKYAVKTDSDFKRGMQLLEQAANCGVEKAADTMRSYNGLVN